METAPTDTSEERPTEEALPPPRMRRSLYKRDEALPSLPSEQLAVIIAFLGTLQSQIKNDEQRASVTTPAPESGRKVLQEKRLQRSGVPSEAPPSRVFPLGGVGYDGFSKRAEPGILPDSGWMDVPSNLSGFVTLPLAPSPSWYQSPAAALAAQSLAPPPEPPAPPRRWRFPLAAALLVLSGLAVGAGAGFVWYAHPPAPRSTTVAPAHANTDYPAGDKVSAEALAVADQALDAMGRGDLLAVSTLLDDARRRELRLPGLSYQAALMAFSRGDEDRLFSWTDRSIDAHNAVPECWYLRACFQNSRGMFQEAAESLEAAAQFDPFNPRYAFFRAEYLRRTGKPALAVPIFQQALRCRPSPLDGELILFKQRLARLETGNDASFQAELAERLGQEPVSGDTFLLGAALEIGRGDFPAAAEKVRSAARVMPPNSLRGRLRDYFFRSQAKQKDLAEAFAAVMPPPPAVANPPPADGSGGKVPVDPATRSLTEADPASW